MDFKRKACAKFWADHKKSQSTCTLCEEWFWSRVLPLLYRFIQRQYDFLNQRLPNVLSRMVLDFDTCDSFWNRAEVLSMQKQITEAYTIDVEMVRCIDELCHYFGTCHTHNVVWRIHYD